MTRRSAIHYVNTPLFDVFDARTGMLPATNTDGDRLTYGIVGGTVRGRIATATNEFGTLRVDTGTGRWTFLPANPALNAVGSAAVASFTTTVTDGRLSSTAALRVHVAPPAATGVTGTFLVGSADPFTASDVRTNLSLRYSTLVKVSQAGATATYRLLNISNISAARSRYVFAIGGPAGWLATSWRRN